MLFKLIFNENNKANCTTCPTLFRATATTNHIEIKAINNGEEYDNLHFNFGSSYSNNYEEKTDAVKLLNAGLSIYSLTQDKQMLASDYRSINDKTTIPLGIKLPITNGMETYTLKVSDFNISNGYKVILHDKLYNKYILLTKDVAYDLVIDPSNKNSVGENRLEIIIKK